MDADAERELRHPPSTNSGTNNSNTEATLHQVSDLLLNVTQAVVRTNDAPEDADPSTFRRSTSHMPATPFDPADEFDSMGRYIDRLEQLSSVNRWDKDILKYMATAHLEGTAKLWFRSQKMLNKSWEE